MKLEETILECYEGYKEATAIDPTIPLKTFSYQYINKDGKWIKGDKPKGTYCNKVYQSHQNTKARGDDSMEFEEWFIDKLPQELKKEAKAMIAKTMKNTSSLAKRILECYEDYKNAADADTAILFTTFTRSYVETDGNLWKKGQDTKGKYFSIIYDLHRTAKKNGETDSLKKWFITRLPKDKQQEAKKIIKEKHKNPPTLSEMSLECFNEYRMVVEKNPLLLIPLETFTSSYIKNSLKIWKKGMRHKGTYFNSIYNKFIGRKDRSDTLDIWLAKNLPKEMHNEAIIYLNKDFQEQRYFMNAFLEYKQEILHESGVIPFKLFYSSYKKNSKGVWYRGTKNKGTYFNTIYNQHTAKKLHGEIRELEDCFIDRLPQELKSEATYYLKGGYLTDRLKALK